MLTGGYILAVYFGAKHDENLARLRAHRQNINRYRLLLQGSLSDLECEYVERRINEEEAALNDLASKTFLLS